MFISMGRSSSDHTHQGEMIIFNTNILLLNIKIKIIILKLLLYFKLLFLIIFYS